MAHERPVPSWRRRLARLIERALRPDFRPLLGITAASFGILAVPASLGESAIEEFGGPAAAFGYRLFTSLPDIISWITDHLHGSAGLISDLLSIGARA